MLEASLAAGVAAGGGHALLGGVLPTPGAALLLRRYEFDLAAVVSASHNPYQRQRHQVLRPGRHQALRRGRAQHRGARRGGRRSDREADRPRARAARRHRRLPARARAALQRPRPQSASRCCWTAPTAPPTAWRPRSSAAWAPTAETIGRRARRAQHQRRLRLDPHRPARARGWPRAASTWASPSTATATACWPWTANGAVVDGDELLALAALHLRDAGRLPGDGVAVTVMTNYGFRQAMEKAGIEVATTPVGDRHVLAELLEPRMGAGRRAVGPHHRDRLRALGRRRGLRAAVPGGAERRRPGRPRRDGRSCPRAWST